MGSLHHIYSVHEFNEIIGQKRQAATKQQGARKCCSSMLVDFAVLFEFLRVDACDV